MTNKINWYNRNYPLIHHLLPAIILEIVLLLMFNFHIGEYLKLLAATVGIIIYPFFDSTIYLHSHRYRFIAGIIASFVMGLSMSLGGISAYLGLGWTVIGLLIPVVVIVFCGMLPGKLKLNGILFALIYSMGIGSPMPIEKMLTVGLWVTIGGVVTALLYTIYYRMFKNIDRIEALFYFSHDHFAKLASGFNPRRIRFGIALYITAAVALLLSAYLSHKLSDWVSPQRISWAPFFVFGMLQYTNDIKVMFTRSWHRFLGTVLGLLLVVLVVDIVHNMWLLSLIFIIVSLAFLSINFRPPSYLHIVGGSSVYVMFLYMLVMHATPEVMLFRFMETIIALLSMGIALALLWPLRRKLMPLGEWEDRN